MQNDTQTKNASCLLLVDVQLDGHIGFTLACKAASPVTLELESWAASPVAAAVAYQAVACPAAACLAAACLAVASLVVAFLPVACPAVACPAAAAVAAAASASAADAAARLELAVSSRVVSSDRQSLIQCRHAILPH